MYVWFCSTRPNRPNLIIIVWGIYPDRRQKEKANIIYIIQDQSNLLTTVNKCDFWSLSFQFCWNIAQWLLDNYDKKKRGCNFCQIYGHLFFSYWVNFDKMTTWYLFHLHKLFSKKYSELEKNYLELIFIESRRHCHY